LLRCAFEADSLDKCVRVIDDEVIEAVGLRPLLIRDSGIGGDRAEETRRERSVDSFEQLQENQADGYPAGGVDSGGSLEAW
jgi:hypothetical protein